MKIILFNYQLGNSISLITGCGISPLESVFRIMIVKVFKGILVYILVMSNEHILILWFMFVLFSSFIMSIVF
jgi:hypothetical protein